MPPLNGPSASLNCTRYPVNTLSLPSSIFTGKFTVSSRFGVLKSSIRAGSRPRRFPTRSICFFAITNGLRSSRAFAMLSVPCRRHKCKGGRRRQKGGYKSYALSSDGSGASAGRAFRGVRGVGHVPQRPTIQPGLEVVDGRMEGDHPLWGDVPGHVGGSEEVRQFVERVRERVSRAFRIPPPDVRGGGERRDGPEVLET